MNRAPKVLLSQWSGLPAAVLVKVSAQLLSWDQQAARLVCTAWRNVLVVQDMVSSEMTNRELHAICREHPDLKRIDLSDSVLLTASSLRHLSSLTGLTSLSLSGSCGIGNAGRNSLAGLEALAQLRELDVSEFSGTPSAVERVCKLTGLTLLDMSGDNEAFSLLDNHLAAHLTRLTNLQWLSLRTIRASTGDKSMLPSAADDLLSQILEGLPLLGVVDLRDVHMTGNALQGFQRHRCVQTLQIAGCQYMTDLTGLHGLPNLSTRMHTLAHPTSVSSIQA